MDDIRVRLATAQDAQALAEMRLVFMADLGDIPADRDEMGRRFAEYFSRRIPTGEVLAAVAEADGVMVGVAVLEVLQRIPLESAPDGRRGHITGVFTQPAYRRRGAAMAMVQLLLREGRALGLKEFQLTASQAGMPMYEKLGFAESRDPLMRLSLEG